MRAADPLFCRDSVTDAVPAPLSGDSLRGSTDGQRRRNGTARRVTYPSGGVELGQDEEDVLLAGVEGSVLEAAVVQLVAQGEERRQGGRCETGCDVSASQVHLLLLPRIPLPLTDVFQQLIKETDSEREGGLISVSHV